MWGAFVLPRTPQLNCQSDDGAEALHVIYGIYVPMIFTMRVWGGTLQSTQFSHIYDCRYSENKEEEVLEDRWPWSP